MTKLILVKEIVALQKDSIDRWKMEGLSLSQENFLGLVEKNHSYNYQLWHQEDKARREDQGFEFVYQAKRRIDHCNQQRNNFIESMDEWLIKLLSPSQNLSCPVHSETPGMIIDRLSIMALKAYHMHLQTIRSGVDKKHQQICQQKWLIILRQQNQLSLCLQELLNEISAQTRTFHIYHTFKMYNDPNLNPELYTLSPANDKKILAQ